MSRETVRVSNQPTSFWMGLILLFGLFMILHSCEADVCKGTQSGIQCMGKAYEEIETEFKKGYDRGRKSKSDQKAPEKS